MSVSQKKWQDLELSKKIRNTNKWEHVTLPLEELPQVELNILPESHMTTSPPPGRPGHDYRSQKRDRESSGSQSELQQPKVSRKGSNGETGKIDTDGEDETDLETGSHKASSGGSNSFREIVEKADLVGEATVSPSKDGEGLKKTPDLGFIHSITGTPSRNMPIQNENSPTSPILTKSSRIPMYQC